MMAVKKLNYFFYIKKYLNLRLFSTHKNDRVVVTGLGIVCPLGTGVPYVWDRLINGDIAISILNEPEYDDLPCRVAALIPKGNSNGQVDLSKTFKLSELKTMSTATSYCLLAAKEAILDANWLPKTEVEREYTGVTVGTGMIDLCDVVQTGNTFQNKGYGKLSPYFIPRILGNMTAGHISIRYGFKGPNHCVSTACATGAHAVGDAYHLIKHKYAKVMICGSTESVISPLSIASFARMRSLSTKFNSCPLEASRPFDKERDGFVMGEGAGIIVLESLEHALSRKAKIYAEIIGYGLSGDAHHITSPNPEGRGAFLCMKSALENADLDYKSVNYINAHATSTPIGDAVEIRAIQNLFGAHSKHIIVSSTKGATGHLLGAAGSIEAIFTIYTCQSHIAPPTVNLKTTDIETVVPIASKSTEIRSYRVVAMTNSFGFGGTNASLIFCTYDPNTD